MGRFPASGARLHEPRQPKPANAAFRQGRPPRNHGSSLGPEHSQRAIRPACREGPTLDVDVIQPPPVPPAQRWLDPPRRPRGALPASSPWNPTGRMPVQAPRGCCPGRAAARRTRDIPAEFRATSARRRQFGGDAGPRGPSRIRRSAPPPGHIGRQAEQGGLASAADRGNPGKSPQRRKAPQKLLPERRIRVGKSRRACRTPAALPIAARGRACPKGPENGLGAGSCADASARSAIAAPEAPQERRQGCTRTPRRRRRSGWTGP